MPNVKKKPSAAPDKVPKAKNKPSAPPARRCGPARRCVPVDTGMPVLTALLLWIVPLMEEARSQNPGLDLHSIEFYSGQAANTKGVERQGLAAVGYDKSYNPITQDILTDNGFKAAIRLLARLKPGGAVWAAPKCSSWVFLCTSNSKRSAQNPNGNTSLPFVAEGNEIAKRTVALLLVAVTMLHAFVYIEQPVSSLMPHAEPLKSFIGEHLPYCIATPLGSFGAPTQKTIHVWSNNPQVSKLKRKTQLHEDRLTFVSHGSVTGRKHNLQASQAYPTDFGLEYGKLVAEDYHKSVLHETFGDMFD